MSGVLFRVRPDLPATGERRGYGGSTVAATGHVPVHTKPIRIAGRPAPIPASQRWAVRRPAAWADLPPEAEAAAVAKAARQERAPRRRPVSLAEHTAAVLAARAQRLALTPPDRRSDAPFVLSPERAELASKVEDMLLAGLSAPAAAARVGVGLSTVQKWSARGWVPSSAQPGGAQARMARAVQMLRDGSPSLVVVAREVGVSRTRLRQAATAAGVWPPPGAAPSQVGNARARAEADERRVEGARLVREEGLSVREAARRAGTSDKRLKAWLLERGQEIPTVARPESPAAAARRAARTAELKAQAEPRRREAARLIREEGWSITAAAKDQGTSRNLLMKWLKENPA